MQGTLTFNAPNQWIYLINDRKVEFRIEGKTLFIEDGPEYEPARRHECMGGNYEINVFLNNSLRWLDDYPGLFEAMKIEIENFKASHTDSRPTIDKSF